MHKRGGFQGLCPLPPAPPGCRLLASHCRLLAASCRLLAVLMNAWVFSEAPQAEARQEGDGKKPSARVHHYRHFGGYRIQNTTYSMEHGTYGLKGM